MGVLHWSLFWYALICVLSSFAIVLTRKKELVVLLLLSFRCLVTVNPRGGGGGALIFSHIRRLGPFFWVQNSEFQYFLGFSEKIIFFGGMKILWIFFWGHHKIGLV